MDLRRNCRYLIVDEVSMLDSSVSLSLHEQLTKIKSKPDCSLGGVNILFVGDFLQLPSVTRSDIYLPNKKQTAAAHVLWRRLNAVDLLIQQMRQANNPILGSLLSRLRIRNPTREDIETLKSRVGVPLPSPLNPASLVYIVRQNAVRSSINSMRIKQVTQGQNLGIANCVARIVKKTADMSYRAIYKIQQRPKNDTQDAILALIPACPLMVMQNQRSNISLVNGSVVEFVGFGPGLYQPQIELDRNTITTEISKPQIIFPPPYMLVRVLEGPGSTIKLPDMQEGVVPLEAIRFTFNECGRSVTPVQFLVTLGYAITDYKCQGSTYKGSLVLNLKKPINGSSPAASPYIQLSRAQSLDQIHVLRPFDETELMTPLSNDLKAELEWEKSMYEKTKDKFSVFLT